MARIADSLAGRLGLTALVTHAVLLPLLYLALDSYVTRSEQEAHVTEIRTYARLVADQIDMASRVEAVTLHLDAALVRRTGEFSVPAGDSTLVLRGISPKLVQQSVRVKGAGDSEALIGAVTVRPSTGAGVESEAAKKLAKLLDEKKMLTDRIDASETKKRAIQNFAKASADAKEPRAVDLPASWAAVTPGLDEADDRIRDLRRQRQITVVEPRRERRLVDADDGRRVAHQNVEGAAPSAPVEGDEGQMMKDDRSHASSFSLRRSSPSTGADEAAPSSVRPGRTARCSCRRRCAGVPRPAPRGTARR